MTHVAQAGGTITVTKSRLLYGKPLGAAIDPDVKEFSARVFETEAASVSIKAERVQNLGNFESVRVGVEIRVPCYVEELPAMTNLLTEKAVARVDTVINDWILQLGNATP